MTMEILDKEKAWFETVVPNPKEHGKAMKVIIEGTWDGEKFVGYNDKGLETIVRKKEWVIFKCQSCSDMGTPEYHTCPCAREIYGDDTECNCCQSCIEICNNEI